MARFSHKDRTWKLALAASALLAGTACGGDDDNTTPVAPSTPAAPGAQDGSTPSTGATGQTPSTPSTPAAKSIYEITTAVYRPDGMDVYVNLSNGVDFNKVDLTKAKQFPAYTGIEVIGGAIFAADGSGPTLTKYEISDALEWKEVGKLDFSAYPLDTDNYLNFYFQAIKDANSVYLFNGKDKTSRVVWNPATLKIVGQFDDTAIPPAANGETINNGGNRTGIRDYVGPVVKAFSKSIGDDGVAPKSWLAVYDPATYKERAVIEIPCPDLNQGTKDEEGNIYFSSTRNASLDALYKTGPATCVVKVKADGTLDTAFGNKDWKSLTGGHYGLNFRYLAQGKALALVLHEERWTKPFTAPINPEDAEKLNADPKLWELELVDIAAGTSKPFTGLKPEHDIGSYLITANYDGRTFIVLQLDEEMAKSALYEAKPDGTLTFAGEVAGEVWSVQKVR
ncbi:MAG: hypothetical protein ABW252_15265 [Polyangiales bacterium]